MLTSAIPDTWQDLQTDAARVLEECGFTVEIEKIVQTVRGDVEVDVFATEDVEGRRYVVLVECKHWKANIPQGVIHAFRTVVADSGANLGYIIATSGFQIGALSASSLTNVRLVKWEEFQTEFERSWVEHHLVPVVAKRLDPLFSFIEPLAPKGWEKLSDADRGEFRALEEECRGFGYLMAHHFSPYGRRMFSKDLLPLPLRDRHKGLDDVPASVLDAVGYRDLLDAALEYGERCIQSFREILSRGAS